MATGLTKSVVKNSGQVRATRKPCVLKTGRSGGRPRSTGTWVVALRSLRQTRSVAASQPASQPIALVEAPSPAAAPQLQPSDAPFCYQCGHQMQRAGSCYVCPLDGTTSGCSLC